MTSPVWDLVTGTHRSVDVVEVPPKHVMPWLVADSGAIRDEHRFDYRLRATARAGAPDRSAR